MLAVIRVDHQFSDMGVELSVPLPPYYHRINCQISGFRRIYKNNRQEAGDHIRNSDRFQFGVPFRIMVTVGGSSSLYPPGYIVQRRAERLKAI